MTSATAAATGRSELASSGPPLGRPKCASKITLPPLSAISVMVAATRSMRVLSVTLPFSVGTFRSTRRSTRLPETSASSSVRNGLGMVVPPRIRVRWDLFGLQRPPKRNSGGASRFQNCGAKSSERLGRQMCLASTAAVSAIRFEKPHSLSYQLRMRTKVPSMTLVWSEWKIDDRGSWLKSTETLGLSV